MSTNLSYPFNTHQLPEEFNSIFSIVVPLDSDEHYSQYYPFFAKFGYEGNGHCWKGHIIQILEQVNPALLAEIDFDPEGSAFFAYTKSQTAATQFVDTLSPIFSDMVRLEAYVMSADRDRIDD